MPGASLSYSGVIEKLALEFSSAEAETPEPALPTPATFVGLAVPAPDRYLDSAQSGASTVETAFVARDLPRRPDINKNRPRAYNHRPASDARSSSRNFYRRDEGESREVHGSEIERLERMLEDLKVKTGYKERNGPSAHYTAAGDDASSDDEHPVQALTAYGVPSPRGDDEEPGFEGFTRVRRREHDELQRRIYEAQPTPRRSKSKGSSH